MHLSWDLNQNPGHNFFVLNFCKNYACVSGKQNRYNKICFTHLNVAVHPNTIWFTKVEAVPANNGQARGMLGSWYMYPIFSQWTARLIVVLCYILQGVPCICWSFFTGIFLLGGSHLWPYLVNMGTSIIWCDSNIKVQYFSVWLWYTLCSPLMAYHHNDRLHEKVSWLLPNHIPIKLLFLFSTQLN